MKETSNRRGAPRLQCRVTVRYAENTGDRKTTSEGQMLDISSGGLAFRCHADENCPQEGQQLVLQFGIPNPQARDSSMMEFNRTGCVLRVQEVNPDFRNIVARFDEPLPVGKVFFDAIGLYLVNRERQAPSNDDEADTDEDISLEFMLEQRIKELEHELTKLRQLQWMHAQPDKTE